MADDVRPIDISELEPCRACRALLPAGADACAACGTVAGDESVPAAPDPSVIRPEPPVRHLWWIGIPAGVLAVAAVIVGIVAGVGFLIVGGAVLTVAIAAVNPSRRRRREGTELVDGPLRTRRWPTRTLRWMTLGGLFFGIALPLLAIVSDRPHHTAAVLAGSLLLVAFAGAAVRFFVLWSDAAGPASIGVPR